MIHMLHTRTKVRHLAAAILLLSGCNTQISVWPLEEERAPVYLGSSPETKTHHTAENTILWSAGDKINLLAHKDGKWLDSESQARDNGGFFLQSSSVVAKDTALARFAIPQEFLKDMSGNWKFWGVYPSNCLLNKQMVDNDHFSFRISPRQVPVRKNGKASFDPDCDVLIGKTQDISELEEGKTYSIYWDRQVAHLCLNLTDIPLKSDKELVLGLSVSTAKSAALTGLFNYELSTGKITSQAASNTVNIVVSGGNIVEKNKSIEDIWLCVLPQTLDSLVIKITTDKAEYTKSWKNISLELKKNCRNSMKVSMKGAESVPTSLYAEDPDATKTYDCYFDVNIPEMLVASHKLQTTHEPYDVISSAVEAPAALNFHFDVLPLYVFGDSNMAGDYYYVDGYFLAHNAITYAQRYYNGVNLYGWYPSEYKLDFQLLDADGNALTFEQLSFLETPIPESTVAEWTYTKGMSFTLGVELTFGRTHTYGDYLPEGEEPGWKNTIKGWLAIGFTWNNSSTQHLPDQTVRLSTDPQDWSINYSLVTMNDNTGYNENAIPILFRNDQRMDFAWVWHVNKGVSCAKDYDFGNMKMKVSVTPVYKININGLYRDLSGSSPAEAKFAERYTYTCETQEMTVDMPALNRIPFGTVSLKCCPFEQSANEYLTNIEVYRQGDYSLGRIYYSDPKSYRKFTSAEMNLRYGTYDIVYKLRNGNTGEITQSSVFRNVVINSKTTIELSTLDGDDL